MLSGDIVRRGGSERPEVERRDVSDGFYTASASLASRAAREEVGLVGNGTDGSDAVDRADDDGGGASRRARVASLRRDLEELSTLVGERSTARPRGLERAAGWIEERLASLGLAVSRQEYEADGVTVANLEVQRTGRDRPGEIVVVGAHYDSVRGSPGANDNASGVAAALALAEAFADRTPARTLRFVFFVNREAPHFRTDAMGSLVYARRCERRGEDVVAMLSLDSLAYYDDAEDSQHLPAAVALFYPSRGDFLAVVGDRASGDLVDEVEALLEESGPVPVESGSAPGDWPGIGWSDHWAFWQCGYPAVVVTDTGDFRDPEYHRWADTPGRLDVSDLASVVEALERAIAGLATTERRW